MALAGLVAVVLGLTFAAPTSASYVATPTAASLKTPVGSWTMPQTAIEGLSILDAAFIPSRGATVMVASAGTNDYGSGIYLSTRPGETPTLRRLPSFASWEGGDSPMVYRVAASGTSFYALLRTETGAPLRIAGYQVAENGDLSPLLEFIDPFEDARAILLFDAREDWIVWAYEEDVSGRSVVQLISVVGAGVPPMSLAATWADNREDYRITGVGIGIRKGEMPRLFISRDGGGTKCTNSCRYIVSSGSSVVVRNSEEAWFESSGFLVMVDGNGRVSRLGTSVDGSAHLADLRKSWLVFRLPYDSDVIERREVANGHLGVVETVSKPKEAARLIPGDAAIMVLFGDGSLGWLIA